MVAHTAKAVTLFLFPHFSRRRCTDCNGLETVKSIHVAAFLEKL